MWTKSICQQNVILTSIFQKLEASIIGLPQLPIFYYILSSFTIPSHLVQFSIPLGTWRKNNVVMTSFQRFDVISTSIQRCSDIVCQLRCQPCLVCFFFKNLLCLLLFVEVFKLFFYHRNLLQKENLLCILQQEAIVTKDTQILCRRFQISAVTTIQGGLRVLCL